MSSTRAVPPKNSNISTIMPPLPSRRQPKRSIIPSKTIQQIPNQDDLDDIVNNLSTIVKRSDELLTLDKSSHVSTTVRRTSSLHIPNRENLSNSFVKTSNSHHDTLTNSNLDISRLNIQRRSLRNVEKFSGIKCSLPSGASTIPHTFKGLEKHCTPTKTNHTIDNQVTPTVTNGKIKSPWRLRFEKFLNHQELTPISPINQSIALPTTKTSTSNKEIRTPSFRLPTRRTCKIHSEQKP